MAEHDAASIVASKSTERIQRLLAMTAPSLNMNETGPSFSCNAVRCMRNYVTLRKRKSKLHVTRDIKPLPL